MNAKYKDVVTIAWGDEELGFLAGAFAKGWLAGKIWFEHQSAGCYPKRTKNAIIGKLHRLGLTRPIDRMGSSVTPIQKRAAKRIQVHSKDQREVVVQKPVPDISKFTDVIKSAQEEIDEVCGIRKLPRHPVPDNDPVREPRQITMEALKSNDCRWPYGDDNYTFCGLPKAKEEATEYCDKHLAHSHSPGYRR